MFKSLKVNIFLKKRPTDLFSNKQNNKKISNMATLELYIQKCQFWPKIKPFTGLSRVNLYSNLKINTSIVFSGSKHMGNDISLIILVISQNFQNGGGGHFGFWKNGGRKNFNPDIPSICDPSWAQISNCFACNNHSPAGRFFWTQGSALVWEISVISYHRIKFLSN